MNRVIGLSIIGLAAGTAFGVMLKLIEQMTGKKVYTLLLNVDYFPILKDLQLNEGIEFSFHLIVSVLLTIVLYDILRRYNGQDRVVHYVLWTSFIGAILFFTTSFSNRTPDLWDGVAFIYWLIGHAVFGLLIGWMIRWKDRLLIRDKS